MNVSTSFKTKLLIVFLLISATPLILAVGLNAMNMITDAENNVESELELRNNLAQMKISELYEKNLGIMRILASTPTLQKCLEEDSKQNREVAESLIIKINNFFHDNSSMAVANSFGQQIVRSDGLSPVNIAQRSYYYEAMQGKESISEVVTSFTTSKFISVIEVPIIGNDGKPIGLIQRNYDLTELQEFVHNLATETTFIIILDKDGKVVANSSRILKTTEDRTDESRYDFVQKVLTGKSGSIRTVFEDEESFICYSRNNITNWAVITVHPCKYTQIKIYGKAIIACGFGIIMLIITVLCAYLMADKITKPLLALSKAVLEVAGKNRDSHLTGDELQQMTEAFGEIKETNLNLKVAAETDKLTKLLNKDTTENFCALALQNMLENSNTPPDTLAALYIIDLDKFKQANDTYGHHHGDLILQGFAENLKAVFRTNDIIGRFGGDEFVVFITNIPNLEIVERKAQQILETARNLTINDTNADITASIGISIAPRDGVEYAALFKAADRNLYCVKNNGRNGYCLDRKNVIH